MKKYISILSLTAAFFMQSCERSDSDLITTEQKELNTDVLNKKDSVLIKNEVSQEKVSDKLETGDDDDEPVRDKQHWKIVQDSARQM